VSDPPYAFVIVKVKGETPTGGVVTSVTVPLEENWIVMVRLIMAASGVEMGIGVPTFEKLVAGGASFST